MQSGLNGSGNLPQRVTNLPTEDTRPAKVTEFHTLTVGGHDFLAFMYEGEPCAAVKPICNALTVDWDPQRRLIMRDKVLSKGTVIITVPSAGGPQETLCLKAKYLHGWLFKIQLSRYKDERVREIVEKFQLECYDALCNYFVKGIAINSNATIQQMVQAVEQLELKLELAQKDKELLRIENQQLKVKNEWFFPDEAYGEPNSNGDPRTRKCRGSFRGRKKAKSNSSIEQMLLPLFGIINISVDINYAKGA